jgi:hypothetical protein
MSSSPALVKRKESLRRVTFRTDDVNPRLALQNRHRRILVVGSNKSCPLLNIQRDDISLILSFEAASFLGEAWAIIANGRG